MLQPPSQDTVTQHETEEGQEGFGNLAPGRVELCFARGLGAGPGLSFLTRSEVCGPQPLAGKGGHREMGDTPRLLPVKGVDSGTLIS